MTQVNLSHPAQDKTLTAAEREYARKMVLTLIKMHKQAERMSEAHFSALGVPSEIQYRAVLHAAKHRMAMTAAGMLAHFDLGEEEIQTAIEVLVVDFTDLIKRQVPVSAKAIGELRAKRAKLN